MRVVDLDTSRWDNALWWTLRCGVFVSREAPKKTMLLSTTGLLWLLLLSSTIRTHILRRSVGKGLAPCILMCILLPLVHLLLELLGLFFIRETETRQAILQLKRMEEGAILIVLEGVVDLLIP